MSDMVSGDSRCLPNFKNAPETQIVLKTAAIFQKRKKDISRTHLPAKEEHKEFAKGT